MSNKILAAEMAALLTIVSMGCVSANAIEVNLYAEMENTLVSAGSADETSDAENEEYDIVREIKPMDILSIDYPVDLYRPDGDTETTVSYEALWVISVDEENQMFRVYTPRFCTKRRGTALYLRYEDCKDAVIESHNGYVMGDLYDDCIVDVFDLAMMKRGILSGKWIYDRDITLADLNADSQVDILDLISLQRWLLGVDDTAK